MAPTSSTPQASITFTHVGTPSTNPGPAYSASPRCPTPGPSPRRSRNARSYLDQTNHGEKTPYNRTVNVRLSSNEGPEQLNNPKTGQQFIIYSAARSDNRNYCLGQLETHRAETPWTWPPGRNTPLDVSFYQNPDEEVYGVGHASFTTSPDGSEDWIVYHGMHDYLEGWSARTIRAQKFTWNSDGTPNFPEARESGPTLCRLGRLRGVVEAQVRAPAWHRRRRVRAGASGAVTSAPSASHGASWSTPFIASLAQHLDLNDFP